MWKDRADDTFDWTRRSGPTPSTGTGPSGAKSGTSYLFIETSSPRSQGDTATLGTAPLFIPPRTTLTFAYHMYGSSIGTLAVKVGSDIIWSKQGDQGNKWETATLDLSSKAGQTLSVEFVGTRGTSYTGDAAIDDITFVQVTMPPSSVPTAAPTQEPTQDVATLFHKYDLDADGVLNLDEFKALIEKLGAAANLLQGAETRRLAYV